MSDAVPPNYQEDKHDDHVPDTNPSPAVSDSAGAAVPAEETVVEPDVSEIAAADAATVDAGLAPPANAGYISEDTELATDRKDDRANLQHLGEPKDVEAGYTIVTHLDPLRQVDAYGVYLDDVERRNAELVRARVEDREPDLDNPPAIASTQLVPSVHAQPVAGAFVPVDYVETVNVGVPADEVATNSAAAAEAHGLNPDGSEKDQDEDSE